MKKRRNAMNALIIENFDILELSNECPEQEVGVHVSNIYVQIAKYRNNPSKRAEIQLLLEALLSANHKNNVDSRYAIMKVSDIMLCFEKDLKTMPKSAFIQIAKLKEVQ